MTIQSAPGVPASFTEDYLNSMPRRELQEKYKIGSTRCNTWIRHVYEKTHIRPPRRRNRRNNGLPPYISLQNGRYLIFKKIKGKSYYFGGYRRLSDAKREVERLKKNGWNKMDVKIDCKEQKRIEPALKHYQRYNTTVEDLPTGDYVFNDRVCFEYKTFSDFIASIIDKRVFNQSIRQREAYPYHFVVLELGEDFNLKKSLDKDYFGNKRSRRISEKQYYGAISKLNTYTTVLPVCGDREACFRVMEKQAEKCLDSKPLIKYPEVKTANSALNYLCNEVRGVGFVTAEKIVEALNMETLYDLINLTEDALVSVDGIGVKTAENIMNKIRRDAKYVEC